MQRVVLSLLVFSIVYHLAVGLVVAAVQISPTVPSSRIGLLCIAAVMGVIAIASAFAIHQRSPRTPWLILGVAPSLLGTYLCLLR